MMSLFLIHRGVRVCNKIVNHSVDVNITKEFLNTATIQVALDVSSKNLPYLVVHIYSVCLSDKKEYLNFCTTKLRLYGSVILFV